jgi:organic hydroperoxide reductase OsmC/OhrA
LGRSPSSDYSLNIRNIMSEHTVRIIWSNNSADEFLKRKYSREHTWEFDGGARVAASSSPSVVPVPFSNPSCVDPEEAFVAAVSSCHMLWFLSLAAEAGFIVENYADVATGLMSNSDKVTWISEITLVPVIVYAEENKPTQRQEQQLHHGAHQRCFIANSIKTKVTIAENSMSCGTIPISDTRNSTAETGAGNPLYGS